MQTEISDVQRELTNFQGELKRIDQAIRLVRQLERWLGSRKINSYSEANKFLDEFELRIKDLAKKIGQLRWFQESSIRKLVETVEKLDGFSGNIYYILRQDIKIKEYVELRTKSLDGLLGRLKPYIRTVRVQLKETERDSSPRYCYIWCVKNLVPVFMRIIDELTIEKRVINEEIVSLSKAIRGLEEGG